MRDEIFDRGYQAGRSELHDGVDRMLHSIMDGFAALNRVQWDAPWKRNRRNDCAGLA